jgi:hypothetical protein
MNPYVIGGIILLAIIAIIAVYLVTSGDSDSDKCVKLNGDCSDGSTCCTPNACVGGVCIVQKDCIADKKACTSDDTCCDDGACVNAVCCNQSSACKTADDCCAGFQCNTSGYCYNPDANPDLTVFQYTKPNDIKPPATKITSATDVDDCKAQCKSTTGCSSAMYDSGITGQNCYMYDYKPDYIAHGTWTTSMLIPHGITFNGINIKGGYTATHQRANDMDQCKQQCTDYKGDNGETCVMAQLDSDNNCWIINNVSNLVGNNDASNMTSWFP